MRPRCSPVGGAAGRRPSRASAGRSRLLPDAHVASASAALPQGPPSRGRGRREFPAVGAGARDQGLSRHGGAGGRAPRRAGGVQPHAGPAAAARRPCRGGQGPLLGGYGDPRRAADRGRQALPAGAFLRRQSPGDRPLPPLPGAGRRPRRPRHRRGAGGVVGAGLPRPPGAVQPRLDRPGLSGCRAPVGAGGARTRLRRVGQGGGAGRAPAHPRAGDPVARPLVGGGPHRGDHHAARAPDPAADRRHRLWGRRRPHRAPAGASLPGDHRRRPAGDPRPGRRRAAARPASRGHVAGGGGGRAARDVAVLQERRPLGGDRRGRAGAEPGPVHHARRQRHGRAERAVPALAGGSAARSLPWCP